MKKRSYTMKDVRKAYEQNIQSNLIVWLFLLTFSIIFGYALFSAIMHRDNGIVIIMLPLFIFTSGITCLTAKVYTQMYKNRKTSFNKKIPSTMFTKLDCELISDNSRYFETVCVGETYLINLNPIDNDDLYIKKQTVSSIQAKKIQGGTKYTYWTNRITIAGKGQKVVIDIRNNHTFEEFITYLKQDFPMITERIES